MSETFKGKKISHPSPSALAGRVDELREVLKQIPVNLLVERTSANYQAIGPGRGEFRLSLIDSPLVITFPDFRVFDTQDSELPPFVQTMLMYYFDSPTAIPVTGKWTSFADLPEGRVYDSAFQGNTGNVLVKTFGVDGVSLRMVCEGLGGKALGSYGDVAYVIQALPCVPVLVNYWLGDEDFPSTCKFLFDESVSHFLPIEACAILGGILTHRILKQR